MRHIDCVFIIIAIFIAAICQLAPGQIQDQTQPSAILPTVTTAEPAPLTADDLPDAALRGDLMVVAVLDFTEGDKTAWNNAWAVISGGKPTTQPLKPTDPLPPGVDQAIGPILATGADRLAMGVSVEKGNLVQTICLRLPAGASDTAAINWLRRNVRANGELQHEGPWIITRANATNGHAAPPSPPLSSQSDDIRQELNCWGEDVPLKILYVSSDPVKKAMMQGGPPPAPIAKMLDLYWDAKYLYIGARLGEHPQVEFRWAAQDADGADAVIKQFDASRQLLKQPDNSYGIPMFVGTAFDQFKPVREDNIVRASLGQKELSNIFAAIIAASMSGQNSNPQAAQQTPVAADWAPTDPAIDSASAQMRLILSAITEYDRQHQSLPASLDDLISAKLLPGSEIFHNPRTNKDNGFVYVKPDGVTKLSDIPHPEKTAILFEEKDGQPDQNGLKGYADGKVASQSKP